MSNAGWGSFGSPAWHGHMVRSLVSVEDVNAYLNSLEIAPLDELNLEAAQEAALQLIQEVYNGSKTVRG